MDEASDNPADASPPPDPVARFDELPYWRKIAYFTSAFGGMSSLIAVFQGRSAMDSLLIGLVAAAASILPWMIYHGLCGEHGGVGFFAIFVICRIYSTGREPTSTVLWSLVTMGMIGIFLAFTGGHTRRSRLRSIASAEQKPTAEASRPLI
jgi:hypothetical protein